MSSKINKKDYKSLRTYYKDKNKAKKVQTEYEEKETTNKFNLVIKDDFKINTKNTDTGRKYKKNEIIKKVDEKSFLNKKTGRNNSTTSKFVKKTNELKIEKIDFFINNKQFYKNKNIIEKETINFEIKSKKKNIILIDENKNRFDIKAKKKEPLVFKQIINFLIKSKNKNNESILTQETTENLNFSIISLNESKESKEIKERKETKNIEKIKKIEKIEEIIKLPDTPKGLNNFSLNCYMNSLLQCFYHMKGLRTKFINPLKFSPETQKVCYALSVVMKGLTYGDKSYFSPNDFKNTLGNINKLFYGCKGADVSDLYRTIVDSIINEIPYEYPEDEDDDYDGDNTNQRQYYLNAKKEVDENNPIIQELNYYFETIYDCPKGVKCYAVQNDTSIMFELLKISKWANSKQLDLYKCFEYNYRSVANNEFYCSKCECTHINNSQDKIVSLPKVLTLILNRGKGKQYYDKVIFYETINIQRYVDDTFIEAKDRKYNYKLIGVSTHLGSSSNCGHYIAYCFFENENEYYCFNDESCRKVDFEDLKHGEPYILFYEQINDTNDN